MSALLQHSTKLHGTRRSITSLFVRILSRTNPDHALSPNFVNTYVNIIFLSVSRSSKRSLSTIFPPTETCTHKSSSHKCHVPRPCHYPSINSYYVHKEHRLVILLDTDSVLCESVTKIVYVN